MRGGLLLEPQLRRVTGGSVRVRVSAVDVGKCKRSRARVLQAPAAQEVADPPQARPPALLVGLLPSAGRRLQLRGPLAHRGPPRLQEVDHTLQDLRLAHLWVLQVLLTERTG